MSAGTARAAGGGSEKEMCGIALSVTGVRIDVTSVAADYSPPTPNSEPSTHKERVFSVDELNSALRRRGPDSLATKTIVLQSKTTAELQFFGATLQLRGTHPVSQPFVDSSGNVLAYNGEIFGGIDVGNDRNDGEVLLEVLGKCCACGSNGHTGMCFGEGSRSIPEVLSMIKGPWAVVYWQNSSRTLWFGRDAFGRRSLLVHWPTEKDSWFLLSSVSPFSSVEQSSDFEVESGINSRFWEELSCGIYSLSVEYSELDECFAGQIRKHEWTNAMLVELIKWERVCVEPYSLRPTSLGADCKSLSSLADDVLSALRKSVMRRINFQVARSNSKPKDFIPAAILFSGGLDCMILAALLHECLDSSYGIDLLNVSFDGRTAPDRISARAGLQELRRIAPSRRWKLVEIDADLSNLTWEMKYVMSLINPAETYMDLNIGIALWLAASGDGWVCEESSTNDLEIQERYRYKSNARIVLVGSGADEQCAGYGRHRTKYRCGSWLGLHEEMKLDMQRIWKRNMGRDDRCIADNGKEGRFPFLDEDVIRTLLDIPLWEVANLDQPSGTGDKKILREVAKMLGLREAAVLPKRAIQFGSRIARESNRKNFGSNRAANQASAGSVVINRT